jgi:RNA polymerase sigma factor (TIGR02999 family)
MVERSNFGSGVPPEDSARLIVEVYDTLRTLARRYLTRERADHTLEPTALVNEAYLRMVGIHSVRYTGKTHFFATAARQMRRVLVEHARAANRQKRGGGIRPVTLNDADALAPARSLDILALDEALNGLAAVHSRPARVAELRLYSGLSVAETAQHLAVSDRTVKNDWRLARAWLARALRGTQDDAQ